jgi:O-antigen/teichoic acid export membrane protein
MPNGIPQPTALLGMFTAKFLLTVSHQLRVGWARVAQARGEILWVVLGQLLAFSGSFVGIKLLTNIMGPESYGRLALGMTIAGLLNLFAYGPLRSAVLRFYSVYREKGQLNVYFCVIRKAHGLCAVIISGLTGLVTVFIYVWAGLEWALLVLMAALLGMASGLNSSLTSIQGALRERRVVALHQGADAWLRPVLAVVALYLVRNTGYSALIGFLIGTVLVSLSQGIWAFSNTEVRGHWRCRTPPETVVRENLRMFYAYARPFVLWAGIATVSSYADRWILQVLYGTEKVGIYAALYQIANAPIALLAGMINQFSEPIIFERAGVMHSTLQAESSTRLLHQTLIVSSLCMLAMTVGTYFFSEPLVRLVTSEAFVGQHSVLWVMVLGLSLFSVGQMLSTKGLCFNQPGVYVFPKFLQGGAFLALAYPLARAYGIPGMAWALCGSSALYLAAILIVNRRFVVG